MTNEFKMKEEKWQSEHIGSHISAHDNYQIY